MAGRKEGRHKFWRPAAAAAKGAAAAAAPHFSLSLRCKWIRRRNAHDETRRQRSGTTGTDPMLLVAPGRRYNTKSKLNSLLVNLALTLLMILPLTKLICSLIRRGTIQKSKDRISLTSHIFIYSSHNIDHNCIYNCNAQLWWSSVWHTYLKGGIITGPFYMAPA